MLVVVAVLPVAVVLSFLLGGRLRGLERAPLRAAWLLVVGLGVRVGAAVGAVIGLVPVTWADHWATILVGHVAVAAWLLVHRHLAGTGLLLVGVVGDAVAGLAGVVLDAGLVDPRAAGWMAAGATVVPLGRLTLSVRVVDLVTAAGVLVLTHTLMSYRPAAERRRALLDARRRGAPEGAVDPEVDAGGTIGPGADPDDPWGPRPMW